MSFLDCRIVLVEGPVVVVAVAAEAADRGCGKKCAKACAIGSSVKVDAVEFNSTASLSGKEDTTKS